MLMFGFLFYNFNVLVNGHLQAQSDRTKLPEGESAQQFANISKYPNLSYPLIRYRTNGTDYKMEEDDTPGGRPLADIIDQIRGESAEMVRDFGGSTNFGYGSRLRRLLQFARVRSFYRKKFASKMNKTK